MRLLPRTTSRLSNAADPIVLKARYIIFRSAFLECVRVMRHSSVAERAPWTEQRLKSMQGRLLNDAVYSRAQYYASKTL